MELKLAKKKLFEGFEVECYEDITRDNGDFFMTRKQIGEALEYKDESSYHRIIKRNIDKIGNPIVVNLTRVEGNRNVSRDIEVYSFKQLFHIIDASNQTKATMFMDWAVITLQELVTGRAELKFKREEDKIAYNYKIAEIINKAVKEGIEVGVEKATKVMENKLSNMES